MKKNQDPYIGLLAYRTAPIQQHGLSPSQLLMGRQLRTAHLPVLEQTLQPKTPDLQKVKQTEERSKEKLRTNYDRRHRARDLPTLNCGDRVWIRDLDRPGTVSQRAQYPRSYLVNTSLGKIRRNRAALVLLPASPTSFPDGPSTSGT